MFKLPIPTRLTDYLGEAVVWTVINRKTKTFVKEFVQLSYCKNLAPRSWATSTAPIVGGQDQDKVMFMYLRGNYC